MRIVRRRRAFAFARALASAEGPALAADGLPLATDVSFLAAADEPPSVPPVAGGRLKTARRVGLCPPLCSLRSPGRGRVPSVLMSAILTKPQGKSQGVRTI